MTTYDYSKIITLGEKIMPRENILKFLDNTEEYFRGLAQKILISHKKMTSFSAKPE